LAKPKSLQVITVLEPNLSVKTSGY